MHEVRTYLTMSDGATLGPMTIRFEYEPGDSMWGVAEEIIIHEIDLFGVPVSNGLYQAITEDGLAWQSINDLVQAHIDDADLSRQADHAERQHDAMKEQAA